MFEHIRHWLLWIRRWRHCRGFGVQSPFAYSFIRYVINEHYPYYSYKKLRKKHKAKGITTVKCGELYLRVANYLQPQYVCVTDSDDTWRRDYIKAGCRKTIISSDYDLGTAKLIITETDKISHFIVQKERFYAENDKGQGTGNKDKDRRVMIVEDIHKDKRSRHQWAALVEDSRVDVTFDLYHVGVAFINTGLHKAHYIVNF